MISFAKKELELINYPRKEELLKIIEILDEQTDDIYTSLIVIAVIKHNDFELVPVSMDIEENIRKIEPFVKKLNSEDRELLIKLLNHIPLSELKLDDDQWTMASNNEFYVHKRLRTIFKENKEDRPSYLFSTICKTENGSKGYIGTVHIKETGKSYLLKKAHPKKMNYFPTIKINVQGEKTNSGEWLVYTTEEELNKIRKFYDLDVKIEKEK